jgi:hypothetical protein
VVQPTLVNVDDQRKEVDVVHIGGETELIQPEETRDLLLLSLFLSVLLLLRLFSFARLCVLSGDAVVKSEQLPHVQQELLDVGEMGGMQTLEVPLSVVIQLAMCTGEHGV